MAERVRLSANFYLDEYDVNERPPEEIRRTKAPRVNVLAQWLRTITGRPVRITSYYRSPARNLAVGGVPTSQHQTGEAIDVEVIGLSLEQVAERVRVSLEAQTAPAFSQLIFYRDTGHVHLGLPFTDPARARRNGELLYSEKPEDGAPRRYTRLVSLAFFPRDVAGVAIVALGLLTLFF